MRYFYDLMQHTWSENPAVATPTATVEAAAFLERHELASLLHQLAVELEQQTRQEIADKAGVRANAGFGPDYGQNVEVAEGN